MSRERKDTGEQLGLSLAPRRHRAPRKIHDTSRAAAEKAQHHTEKLRALIIAYLGVHGPHTADEIAEATALSKQERDDVRRLMEFRRRASDLHTKLHQIRDSGARRPNAQGNAMIVWELGDARR